MGPTTNDLCHVPKYQGPGARVCNHRAEACLYWLDSDDPWDGICLNI
jgi:hypothetical protein